MKKWYTESLETIRNSFNLVDGLSSQGVKDSLAKHGKNELTEKESRSKLLRFLDQFKDVMILVLLVAALISLAFGDRTEAIIIVAIVLLNALIGFVQENKAEESLKALQEMSSPHTKVIRNGKEEVISSKDLVVGDLILLEAGDLVSADIRLVQGNSLQIEEASLTGESVPVEKDAHVVVEDDAPLGDRKNMAYSSGMVTYGRGMGVVVSVGMDTEVGKIAQMLQSAEDTQTPLQRKLDKLGKTLGLFALAATIFIFILSILKSDMDLMESFMMSVSLAVAVIPEGLPAVSTIVLAMGVKRLVEKHAIIRTLPSVETLGSASVICSDKTGTLTQNKMTVMDSWSLNTPIKDLSRYFAMCNDSSYIDEEWVGDPTETALTNWSDNLDVDTLNLSKEYPRINEIPFDSKRKRMTTAHQDQDQILVLTKGGVDEILNVSNYVLDDNEIKPITQDYIDKIQDANINMASKALRVLALAYKNIDENPQEGDLSLEENLVFVGLVGMIDPPREEVFEAIETCKLAGIEPVMITGDHAITAEAIANDIGLLDNRRVVSGQELALMSDDDLYENVLDIGVYARVSPEDKMRIITAWKKHGHIVAMTGDGVNDAPALKHADIGAAMGIVGTEVAKGASDMILTDDNFATVVTAVSEGRRIKDNIMKAITYLLSCNVGELITLLIAILFGLGTPLIPIHILWVNLVTDSLPALALGVDPADEQLMTQKPDTSDSLLTSATLWRILYQGVMISTLTLIAFMYGSGRFINTNGDLQTGQTMAFAVLALSQLVHAYNIHSPHKSVFRTFFKNKWLVLATLINAVMMIAVMFVPFLRDVFSLSALSLHHWEIIIVLIVLPLPIVELMKLFKLNGQN